MLKLRAINIFGFRYLISMGKSNCAMHRKKQAGVVITLPHLA